MGENELAKETAEKISSLFGVKAFDEKTFKVKDIIMDLFPAMPDDRAEYGDEVGEIIDDIERAVSDLASFKTRLEEHEEVFWIGRYWEFGR